MSLCKVKCKINDDEVLVYKSFAAEILEKELCSETEICLISTGQKTATRPDRQPDPTGDRPHADPARPVRVSFH